VKLLVDPSRGGRDERFDVKKIWKNLKKSSDAAALWPTTASEHQQPPSSSLFSDGLFLEREESFSLFLLFSLSLERENFGFYVFFSVKHAYIPWFVWPILCLLLHVWSVHHHGLGRSIVDPTAEDAPCMCLNVFPFVCTTVLISVLTVRSTIWRSLCFLCYFSIFVLFLKKKPWIFDPVAVMKILWLNLNPLIHQTVQIYPVLSLFYFIYFHFFFTYLHYNFYFLVYISLAFKVCYCLFVFTLFFISFNLLVYYLMVFYFVTTLFNLCLKLLHAYLILVTHFY